MFLLANALTIIIVVVAVVVACIVAFYITRMMKGKIELELTKTGFNTGEAVSGRFTLTTKKSLGVRRLFVSLIGYEKIERRNNDSSGGGNTERREIYRDEFNVAEGQTLPAGFHQTYEFALTAPGQDTVGSQNGGLDMNISIGPISLGGDRRRLEWKVEARADLPGVDIAKSRSVRINVS